MGISNLGGRAAPACIGIAFVLLAGCASRPARIPITVEEVVQMSSDGLPASDIIARMDDSDTVYRLSGSELAALKERGVADEVLDYMQDTYVDYERSRAYRHYDPWWGPPYAFAYPYWGYYGPYYYYPYRPYLRHRAPYARPPKSALSAGSGSQPQAQQPAVKPQKRERTFKQQVR